MASAGARVAQHQHIPGRNDVAESHPARRLRRTGRDPACAAILDNGTQRQGKIVD